MADTTTVFLVYRKEGAGIRNIFGSYKSRTIAEKTVDEIVDEETSHIEDEEKQEKAAERVEGKLEIRPLTVRSKPVY